MDPGTFLASMPEGEDSEVADVHEDGTPILHMLAADKSVKLKPPPDAGTPWEKLQLAYPWPAGRPDIPPLVVEALEYLEPQRVGDELIFALADGLVNRFEHPLPVRQVPIAFDNRTHPEFEPRGPTILFLESFFGDLVQTAAKLSPDLRIIATDRWNGQKFVEGYGCVNASDPCLPKKTAALLRFINDFPEGFKMVVQNKLWNYRNSLALLQGSEDDAIETVSSLGVTPDIVHVESEEIHFKELNSSWDGRYNYNYDLFAHIQDVFPNAVITGAHWNVGELKKDGMSSKTPVAAAVSNFARKHKWGVKTLKDSFFAMGNWTVLTKMLCNNVIGKLAKTSAFPNGMESNYYEYQEMMRLKKIYETPLLSNYTHGDNWHT